MAGLFERLKTAYENRGETEDWKNIADTLSPKKAMKRFEMRGERAPEPTTIQKRIKKSTATPSNIGAGSSPATVSTKKATSTNIAKSPDKRSVVDPLAYEATPARRVPTLSFDARDTIPYERPGSPVFNKARENIQRRIGGRDIADPKTGEILESSTWLPEGKAFSSSRWEKTVGGQPNVNYDPKAIMPEGYYNEAGTFIHGPRVKMKDLGIGGYSEGIKKQAGVLDPETGRIGSELARRGEQTLSHIRGRYAENIAKIRGESDVERTRIAADATRGETTTPLKPYTGTLSQEDPETGYKSQIPYSEYTGQPAPGYGAASADLPDHVLKQAAAIKKRSQKEFDDWAARQNKSTRETLRNMGF